MSIIATQQTVVAILSEFCRERFQNEGMLKSETLSPARGGNSS